MIDFPSNDPPVPTTERFEPMRSGKTVSTFAERKASSPILILVAWLVVSVPLGWGITQTVKTSMALFHPTSTQPAQTVK